jgi:hypothetical protein
MQVVLVVLVRGAPQVAEEPAAMVVPEVMLETGATPEVPV